MSHCTARAGVFPLPSFSLPTRPRTVSRRSQQRFSQSLAAHVVANSSIYSLNELSPSFVSNSATPSRSITSHLSSDFEARNHSSPLSGSATQSNLLAHIYQCASRFVSRRGSHGSVCDDTTSLISDVHQFAQIGSYINKSSTPVVPVMADRISLPVNAGSVQLTDILPTQYLNTYSATNCAALFRPMSERELTAPPRLCASQPEWIKLVRRLADANMVTFTRAPKIVNGVFAVPKDANTDRLIIDARPANAQFVEPEAVRLPTADLLAKLETDKTKPLYAAKVDLDNFYHRLRLPEWMVPYFALPPVRDATSAQRLLIGSVRMCSCIRVAPLCPWVGHIRCCWHKPHTSISLTLVPRCGRRIESRL